MAKWPEDQNCGCVESDIYCVPNQWANFGEGAKINLNYIRSRGEEAGPRDMEEGPGGGTWGRDLGEGPGGGTWGRLDRGTCEELPTLLKCDYIVVIFSAH